jgi:P-type E1-E2 ATPase
VESTSPNPVESRNIAYFSNLVREGSGTAIVVETGRRTYFGKMLDDHSISTLRKPDPVDEKLRQFTKWLSVAVIIVVVALFCLGFGLKYPPQTNLQYAIGMLIAGVPEGLLFEILVIKLINVTRISRRKILSKSVATLQRLNTVSCIITDYMGILTKNKLEASQLWYNGSIHAADSPEKYGEDHQYQFDPE